VAQKHVFSEGLFTARNLRSLGTAAILEVAIAFGLAGILIWEQLHPTPAPPPVTTASVTIPPNPPPPPPPPPHNVPTPIPTPNAVPVQPPSPPPIPTSKPVNQDTLMAEFQASMKAAIDAAKVYPKEAILAGETGTVTVSFDYINGVVSNIKVDRSSGSRALDRSAMNAVQKAQMPPKPAELAGISHFVVLVNYTLGS